MNDPVLVGAAAVLFLGLMALLYRTRQAGRARDRSRLSYFVQCAPLLSGCRWARKATGFPRLAGQYRGVACDLQAVPDTLTFRKLPALWVLVTLPGPVPVRGTLDLMIRPRGLEPFSAFATLPGALAAPAGFPQDCALRTDGPEGAVSPELLRPHLGLFDDGRVKEVVITPKGIRAVFLAEEADRSRYLIFRDAEMGQIPLDAERLQPVLERLLAIRSDLFQARSGTPAADAA